MISAQIRAQVRQRAQNACEYCHLHQDDSPLVAPHVEHIIPRKVPAPARFQTLLFRRGPGCDRWQSVHRFAILVRRPIPLPYESRVAVKHLKSQFVTASDNPK